MTGTRLQNSPSFYYDLWSVRNTNRSGPIYGSLSLFDLRPGSGMQRPRQNETKPLLGATNSLLLYVIC